MVTEQERDAILQNILAELRNDVRIVSVILAGSTSRGFQDRYSDIDLVIVIENESFDLCCDEWIEWFENTHSVLQRFGGVLHHGKQIFCYFLEGYLEVDLVFESRNAISPRTDRSIEFDRTGVLEEEFIVLDGQVTESQKEQYQNSISNVWYNITRGAIALHRGNVWRAYHETLQIMYKTAELAGIRYNKETDDLQSIELLPNEFVMKFKDCVPTEITLPAIERSFRGSIELYFIQALALDQQFEISTGREMEEILSVYPGMVLDGNR